MNEKDFTLLNDYFNGLLPPEAERQVLERVANDNEFATEFNLRRDMEAFPRRNEQRQAFQETLKRVGLDFFTEGGSNPMRARVNWGRWMAVAAGVVLLIGAVWFFNRPGPPEYRQYAQHAPLSLTVRGASDQLKSSAETAFAAGDYTKALQNLEQIQQEEPDNLLVKLSRAICLIETGRTADARTVLEPVAEGASALKTEARWYLALSWLKENNYEACKAELLKIEASASRSREAKKLLNQLNNS
ncbi:MAG: tetratricopeptide repeat protein [Saprospiraceae bacterium]|nr:tetratricopeptide repeat protein [Saprospiraceae bacterium]